MQPLPGFRDLFPAEAARRNAIISTWRDVARTHGFDEYDGPTLEPFDLYAKKNAGGEEILGQLYRFEDGGGRHVALRPEMTPTLARLAAAREKHFRKPLKWFSVGTFFRYERQQRGRLREFLQFNCDILGEGGSAADAELIALAVDSLRAFGFRPEDIVVRLGHRGAWLNFLESQNVDDVARVLQVVDKIERDPGEVLAAKLEGTGISLDVLRSFISGPQPTELDPLVNELGSRGLGGFFEIDLSIVRGLAYYTGVVFEIFDRARTQRALAGGGRYDGLVKNLSDGAADLPAVGFGMGDVVLSNVIASVPHTEELMAARTAPACDVFVVIADESRRPEALSLIQILRDAGLRVEFPFLPARVGKQFQSAAHFAARHAVVVGAEWPEVNLKNLLTREESRVTQSALVGTLKNHQL